MRSKKSALAVAKNTPKVLSNRIYYHENSPTYGGEMFVRVKLPPGYDPKRLVEDYYREGDYPGALMSHVRKMRRVRRREYLVCVWFGYNC